MHHLVKVSFGKVQQKPFHAECSCGTQGDFNDHEAARGYAAGHLARLQGINTAEFIDDTMKPLEPPK